MNDAFEDLSALARRDALSAPERQRLEFLLQSSAEARLFHELGERFDAEDSAPPMADSTSEALVERLLNERSRTLSPRRRGVPRTAWLIAAAALLAASLAGAVIGVQRWGRSVTPSAPSAAPASRAPRARPATSRPAAAKEALGAASQDVAPPALSSEAAAPLRVETASPSALPSAAELLSAAGRARRSGQPARALELLRTLRTRYPHSPEASAAEITLGKLELERGAAAPALADFDGYLRQSPHGALAPEALWGRARALAQLGRSNEAHQSLSELLERFPNSPYSSAARAKLSGAPTAAP